MDVNVAAKHAGWQLFTVIIRYDENKNSTEFGCMGVIETRSARKAVESQMQQL